MTFFTDFFSGQPIEGQQFKGQNLKLSKGTTRFYWPIPGGYSPTISQIMNITDVSDEDTDEYIIELPPANQTSAFKSILFVNKSLANIIIHSSNDDPSNPGEIIKKLIPPHNQDAKKQISAFFIYLENGDSVPGIWFSVAFGSSGIILPEGNAITGNGIKYDGQSLFRVTDTVVINQNPFSIKDAHSTKLLINKYLNQSTETNIVVLPDIATVSRGFFVYLLNATNTPLSLKTSGTDTINGTQGDNIMHQDFSMCVCVDQENPKNWLIFINNNSLAPESPLYLNAITTNKSIEVTHKMNGSTLICMSQMTPGFSSPPNIYGKIEVTLPDPSTLPPAPSGNGFNFYMVNRGDGEVRLKSKNKINGLESDSDLFPVIDHDWMTFGPRTSCLVVSDGADWYTLMHGVSSGRIVFFNDDIDIYPSHFGATLLYYGSTTKYINLSKNRNYLWTGFRVTISSGYTDGKEYKIYAQTNNNDSLNGVKNGSTQIFYMFNKDLRTFPFGTTTFVYNAGDVDGEAGWWQI